ncbi:hypothetical protein CBR_g50373 [Chara braunii]|nr:hypothetical protein CBR_g50373 [Chara braunii]|eukprot:GBG90192.1 hypothetical protein CBR_g50373 [Chara braunii]
MQRRDFSLYQEYGTDKCPDFKPWAERRYMMDKDEPQRSKDNDAIIKEMQEKMKAMARQLANFETKVGTTYRDKPGSPYSLRWDRRNTDPWRSVEDRNPHTMADYRARERDEDERRRKDEDDRRRRDKEDRRRREEDNRRRREDEERRRRDDNIDRDRQRDGYRGGDSYGRGDRVDQYPHSPRDQYPRSPRYGGNAKGYWSPSNFNSRDREDSRERWELDRDRRDGYRNSYERTGRDGDRMEERRRQYEKVGYPASPGYPKSPNYPRSPGPSNQDTRRPAIKSAEERPSTPRNSCIYCRGDDHLKRDCPDLKRAIDEGLVVLDDRKYVKWADNLDDGSMFPSMKENVEARRLVPNKGKGVARAQSVRLSLSSDEESPITPIRVATTKSARASSSKKADTDYVMAEKDGQRIEGEEVILSPRKRGARKFTMKSTLDDIDTVEPLRRALRQPMQCTILEYLAASRPAQDELQMITRKARIPLSDEVQMATKQEEIPAVAVSSVVAKADRAAMVFLDGMGGVPPDKFYVLGSGTVQTTLNDKVVLHAVIDNGSETVIIDEALAVRLGLDLDGSYQFEIETADGRKQKVVGVCHKAAIEVEGLRVMMPVFAVRDCSAELLLGWTWLSHVHAITIERPDGSQMLSIKRPDGGRIMMETVEPRDPRNRAVLAVGGRVPVPLASRSLSFREKKYGPLLTEEEGYNEIPLDLRDRHLTAMYTPLGLVQMMVVPMGWTNGVAVFQRVMVAVLKDFIPDKVEVFLDDFPIKGPVLKDETEAALGVRRFVEQYLTDIYVILEQLDQANLTVSRTKSRWAVSMIKILAFICDAKGRRPDPGKLEKLLNWPTPLHSATEVRQFLGVVGYWRIFIRGYAEKAEPLRTLLRKTEKFYWDCSQELAVQSLKEEFKKGGRILGVPFFEDETNRPFIVSTDVGPRSVGGLLFQKDVDGKERPLRFESRTLNIAERKYSQFKKEVLAVLRCLDTLRHYIYGRRFVLRVDPTAVASVLQKDFSLTDPTITRWLIRIRLYDDTVERISGAKNAVADGLSRVPIEAERPISVAALTMAEPKRTDRFLVNLYEGKYRTIGLHLSGEENTDSDIRRQAAQYCLRAGHLFRRPVGAWMPLRVVCDPEEKQSIVAELHDGVVGGHRGVKGTYEKVRKLYWWEGQYKDVEKYCETCEDCQKRSLIRYKEPLHPSYPTRPGEKVHIDLVKMPKGVGNMNYVVNIRDDFTGFVDGKPIRTKTAREVKNFVLEYLSRYGCVSKIVMDRGAEFLADEVQNVFKRAGARVSIATVYHPQSNAPVERGHQSLIASLSKWCRGKDGDWPKYFRYAIWADNVTVRASTGYPPYTLWFGRHCPLPIEFQVDSWTTVNWAENMTREELLATRTRQIAYGLEDNLMTVADRRAVQREKNKVRWDKDVIIKKEKIKVGDVVLLYDAALERTWTGKLANRWMGPYRVLGALSWGACMIAELDGSKWKDLVAGARLKLFRSRETPTPAPRPSDPKGNGKAKITDGGPSRRFDVGESSKKRKRVETKKVKGLALGKRKKWVFVLQRPKCRVHIRKGGAVDARPSRRRRK